MCLPSFVGGEGCGGFSLREPRKPKRLRLVESHLSNTAKGGPPGPYDQSFIAEISRREDGIVHNLAMKSDGFRGEVVTTKNLLSNFDPVNHFLVKFHASFPGERPDGYSGAGVWFPRPEGEDSALWGANPLLTGIQTHAYHRLGILKIVRSAAVHRFLEETFPSASGGTIDRTL